MLNCMEFMRNEKERLHNNSIHNFLYYNGDYWILNSSLRTIKGATNENN
jgi:hypothetical protein